jgi:hypothetical protein
MQFALAFLLITNSQNEILYATANTDWDYNICCEKLLKDT